MFKSQEALQKKSSDEQTPKISKQKVEEEGGGKSWRCVVQGRCVMECVVKNKIAAEAAVAAYNAAENGSGSYRGNRPEAYRIVDIGPESYLQGVK